MTCRYCNGTGRIAVEPNSTTGYRCPDCQGNGQLYGGARPLDEIECDDGPEDDDND